MAKYSLGASVFHDGEALQVNQGRFVLNQSSRFYVFDIVPMGAVRMSSSDRWKKADHPDPKKRARPEVVRYFQWKDRLRSIAASLSFALPDQFEAIYFTPMPESWSKKKKELMNGRPCQTQPDTDNITKALKDALLRNDGRVWKESAEKRWAYYGSILIYT